MLKSIPSLLTSQSSKPQASRIVSAVFCLRWSSTSTDNNMPQMHHLEHVQKRLEHTVPLMFRQRLDYTFYRPDVVCENLIMNSHKVGLDQYIKHISVISVWGQMAFPFIKMVPLSINLIHEDGSVRLRWRIAYLNWLNALNWKSYKSEWREKNARWFDGNATFFVDADGLVYKIIISKMTPDDSFPQNPTKKLAEKIGILPQSTANFFQINPMIKKDDEKPSEEIR